MSVTAQSSRLASAASPPDVTSGGMMPDPETPVRDGFHVHLDNFEGPFDLLLSLIAKHKLDITEVALGEVTNEFISYIRNAVEDEASGDSYVAGDPRKNLGVASEFLVIAATLLDLKAARLLPTHETDDEDAIELLEARDLLFAKLLQYRAYKHLAAAFEERLTFQSALIPRSVALEPQLAAALPPLVWKLDPEQLHALAARAFGPVVVPEPPRVAVTHLHAPRVSIAQEAPKVVAALKRAGTLTFTQLISDDSDPLVAIVRFLVLLELFRDSVISFTQETTLGELTLTWEGPSGYTARLTDEYLGAAHQPTAPTPEREVV